MALERDLHDLLYCHDLVIVPNWGGFLTHYRPARIDEARQVVHPPGKDLSFNRSLDRSDGLLADHLSRREGRPYKEARQMVEDAVAEWRRTLEVKGRLELPHVGVFYRDAEKNLQFDPDRQVNFLKEAYGLRPVVAIPVVAVKEPLVFTLPAAGTLDEPAGQRPARIAWAAAAAAAIVFGVASMLAYQMGGPPDSQWSGFDPFGPAVQRTYTPIEEPLEAMAVTRTISLPGGLLGVTQIPLLKDDGPAMIVDLGSPTPVMVPETTSVTMPAKKVGKPAARDRFHIIGGCFAQEENAERFLNELQGKGFQASRLARYNELHPVAFGSFARREDALRELDRVKASGTYSAWLMVR